MSQVKNLRAMFEQKQDGSPPEKGSDRGRSPAESAGTATPPPRPLSKVRTNFVAVVEKDGRVGLRRDPSSDSIPTTRSLSQRRLSVNTEEGSASVVSDRTSNMALATETIPESPRQPEPKATARPLNGFGNAQTLGALSDRPSLNPDKHVDLETPTPRLLPGDPTEIPPSQPLAPAKSTATSKLASTPKAAKTKAPQETSKPATAKHLSKPHPVNTKLATKPPAKSPSLPRTPTSLPKSVSQPLPAKTHPPKRIVEKSATPKTAAVATKAATPKHVTPTTSKKATPAPVSIPSSSSTGFVKPKPKSPTRPLHIPSSLMAGTASSQSKVKHDSRDSLAPKASGLGRSPSRASVSTVGTTPAKTIRRQRSSINNHSRPSLGPPPKKTAQDHPVTKKERDVDEGFLARMARPTVSSASKVNDKVPVTPPRKPPTRASSTGTSTRKPGTNSALAATGSPGAKKKSSSVLSGGDEAAEVSKIEQAEVEEALRNATEIPEVAEPEDIVETRTVIPTVEAPESKEAEEQPAAVEVEPEAPSAINPGPEATETPAAVEEHVVAEPVAEEPAEEEPAEEEPATEEPAEEEPAKEEPAAEELIADEPKAIEALPEEPLAPIQVSEVEPVQPLSEEPEVEAPTDTTEAPVAHVADGEENHEDPIEDKPNTATESVLKEIPQANGTAQLDKVEEAKVSV